MKRGDIVLANLAFTDLSGAKVRPALVVQCDVNNARLEDVIVAMITRTIKLAAATPTQLLIDITTPDGKATRLLHTSAVKCEHLITLDKKLVRVAYRCTARPRTLRSGLHQEAANHQGDRTNQEAV
jgi:mRNA interferase MazF